VALQHAEQLLQPTEAVMSHSLLSAMI